VDRRSEGGELSQRRPGQKIPFNRTRRRKAPVSARRMLVAPDNPVDQLNGRRTAAAQVNAKNRASAGKDSCPAASATRQDRSCSSLQRPHRPPMSDPSGSRHYVHGIRHRATWRCLPRQASTRFATRFDLPIRRVGAHRRAAPSVTEDGADHGKLDARESSLSLAAKGRSENREPGARDSGGRIGRGLQANRKMDRQHRRAQRPA